MAVLMWLGGAVMLFAAAVIAMIIGSLVLTVISIPVGWIGLEALEVIVAGDGGKLLGGGLLFMLNMGVREEYDFPLSELPILLGGLYGLGVVIEGGLWWF